MTYACKLNDVQWQSVDSADASWERDVTAVASSNDDNNNQGNDRRTAGNAVDDTRDTPTITEHLSVMCAADSNRLTGAVWCNLCSENRKWPK